LVWTFVLHGWQWLCDPEPMVSPVFAGCALTHAFAHSSTADAFTRPWVEHIVSSGAGWYMFLQQEHDLER
jgi:hypothetical protein